MSIPGFVTTAQSYSVLPTDQVINVIPSTGLTILLPRISSVPVGKYFVIKDIGGTAATTNVGIAVQPGATIDGSSSSSLVQNYGVISIYTDGQVWYTNNENSSLVSGPPSVTTNTLPRYTGTSGKALTSTGIVITDTNAMSGELWAFTANPNITTGYTLTSSDTGKLIQMNLSVSRALTLPNNMAAGFGCDVVQTGLAAGNVVFSPAAGATLTGNSAVTTSKGIWARCQLYVSSNASGTSAVWVFS